MCNQYHEFIEELRDFQDLCNEGMVEPEVIEQAKQAIEPLKDNWQKLNYIFYLLNKPNKKDKQSRYDKVSKNLTDNSISDTQVYEQNKDTISNLQ